MKHLTDEQAQALVDRALPDAERERCAEHVAGCAGCSLVVESYRALAAALDELGAPAPPADFTAGVMARIEQVEAEGASERRLAGGILAVAAALAVALLALAGGGWAPTVATAAGAVTRLASALALAVDVAAPIIRVLRVQIAVACAALAVPLLVALWRLVPRGAEAAA